MIFEPDDIPFFKKTIGEVKDEKNN